MQAYHRSLIKQALEKGLPDMALTNCHTLGLDSIVLQCECDEQGNKTLMRRIFIAWPEIHNLDKVYAEDGHFIVGMHNHRYDLTIDVLGGTVINREMNITDTYTGEAIYEFSFNSALRGALTLSEPRTRYVLSTRNRVLKENSMHNMFASEIHTVVIPKFSSVTAWMITERKDLLSPLFYSPITNPYIDMHDLYKAMSVSDAEQMLKDLLDGKI